MKDSHTMSIISSDKDLKQLINPVVRRQDPFRNNHYTHQEFLNEYGFDPQYFGEYLTLLGDVSDNIPGVAGIGPKTAIGLIQQYQTIESIYVHLDDISPKIATKLRDNEKNARLSHELIRLRCVPDQNTSIPDIRERFDPVVWHRVLIEQYGFPSLAKLVAEVTKEYQSPKAVSLFG
jgi:DNA polymerase-1